FQSRSFRSSPGTYLRCSLNSTEKPWNGLACRPARKPSTMNLARRSSRATCRMTSGRRYFSGALIGSIFSHQQGAVQVKEAVMINLVNADSFPCEVTAHADAKLFYRFIILGIDRPFESKELRRADHVLHEPGLRGVVGHRLQPGGPGVQLGADALL